MDSKPEIKCHVCNSNQMTLFASYPELGRVTSDCKPWPSGGKLGICSKCCIVQKVADENWRAEIQNIYSNYELFHQSQDQKEQPVFNCTTGESAPRSHVIMDYANSKISIGEDCNIIDIGCGVGNTLKSLGKIFSNAKLYGFEPYVRDMQTLKSIKNVVEVYTAPDQFADQKFDLMTMFHVLEHIEDPKKVLENLASAICKDGHLIIAVPDYQANPFDLAIADHASHFSSETLKSLLETSGWNVVDISSTHIKKEILLICKVRKDEQRIFSKPQYNYIYIQKQINWMAEIVKQAKKIEEHSKPFGIFGTSIAANWLYGAMKNRVDYFVDEDPDRSNRQHHNKPVYHSSQIPNGSHTLVCLQPSIVTNVIERLNTDNFTLYPTPIF